MSSSPKSNTWVTIFNSLFCLATLACLVVGIVFLKNPEISGLDPDRSIFIGKILTSIGGTLLCLQIVVLLIVCCVLWCCAFFLSSTLPGTNV